MKITTVKSVAMILFALFAFSINGISAESNSSFLKLDKSLISDKDKNEIIIRNCSRPIQEATEIYVAVKISSMPFTTKKYVVTH